MDEAPRERAGKAGGERRLIMKWGAAEALRQQAKDRKRALRCWLRRLLRRSRTARILVGLALFVIAIVVLVIASNSVENWGLWGDLAFAIAITTAVLGAFFYALRRWLSDPRRPTALNPLGWGFGLATFVLLGIPIAVVTWPTGTLIASLPIVLCLIGNLLHRYTHIRLPILWECALVSVAIFVIYVALGPSVRATDRVPRAVPAAQIENADIELATTFRPYLFFDAAERRYPLDIEDAIEQGRVHMCQAGVRRDDCPVIESAAEIDDNATYLEFEDALPPRRGGDDSSAYYFRVSGDGDTTYVDYWWFYARNPSPVADDVFCGPGFQFPPYTCQEHAGDWEGITVVLEGCLSESETCVEVGGELLHPTTIRYAQHEHVRPYAWQELEARWSRLTRPSSAALGPVWEDSVLPAAAKHGPRPLVFVAHNSHASYPDPCFAGCSQVSRSLPESRHDGGLPWSHNTSCVGCVKPLPLTSSGDAALWNAFSGRWGGQECILGGAYCDFSPAPRSPSHQTRYADPGVGG